MVFNSKTLPMFALFIIVGAIGAITIMHPLVLIGLWFEFSKTDETPALLEFIHKRLLFGFLPRQMDMVLLFGSIGGCFGLIFAFFTRSYLQRSKSLRFMQGELGRTIPEIIKSGESERVEFKSSLRWDVQMKSVNKALENVIAKTIAGFCNTHGGSLLIGVADNGDILGLSKDYSALKQSNRDGFELAITSIVKKKLGGDLSPLIHFSFREIEGEDVCMLSIEPAPARYIWMKITGLISIFAAEILRVSWTYVKR